MKNSLHKEHKEEMSFSLNKLPFYIEPGRSIVIPSEELPSVVKIIYDVSQKRGYGPLENKSKSVNSKTDDPDLTNFKVKFYKYGEDKIICEFKQTDVGKKDTIALNLLLKSVTEELTSKKITKNLFR